MGYLVCRSCKIMYHNVDDLIALSIEKNETINCTECSEPLIVPETALVKKDFINVKVPEDDSSVADEIATEVDLTVKSPDTTLFEKDIITKDKNNKTSK